MRSGFHDVARSYVLYREETRQEMIKVEKTTKIKLKIQLKLI